MKDVNLYEEIKKKNNLHPLIRSYETDNRDLEETTLWLDTEDRVDVNPWDLIIDAIENSVDDEDLCEKLLTKLDEIKGEIEEYLDE